MKTPLRFACLMLSVMCLFFQAHAEITAGEWIAEYNAHAPSVNAPLFSEEDGEIQAEAGVYVYFVSDASYIAVYIGSSGNADAMIVEAREDNFDVKAATAASVAASDALITPERAAEILTEAEAQMTEDAGERYAYMEADGWIFMLSDMRIGVKRYTMYSAVRESAYSEIVGEESESEETAPEEGQEDAPEEKEAPKSEKQTGDQKVYKI